MRLHFPSLNDIEEYPLMTVGKNRLALTDRIQLYVEFLYEDRPHFRLGYLEV